MRERFILPILLILGLALYFPALQSGTFILDDGDVMAQARGLAERSILNSFFYGSGATYYRPVLMLTYMLDLVLLDLHPGFMHLVNLLLHIGNTFLVYLNVRVFVPRTNNGIRGLPFTAALLFLIHPLTTESVNWISGRTDPLAAFFALGATWLAMKSIQDGVLPRLWLASFLLILGSMSKEVAFFVFPALILFIALYRTVPLHLETHWTWSWRCKAIIPFVAGGITYFFMRTAAFDHVDKGVAKVTNVRGYQEDPIHLMQQLVTDIGFYSKKLLVPSPLSLAIDKVAPAYLWAGVLALALFLLLVCLRNTLTAFALLIALTIFPALLNALLHIAWTPYAERYMYLPAAYFCIGLSLPILDPRKRALRRMRLIAMTLLLISFLPTTISRNQLWAAPLELTRLTRQQNPDNPTVWGMYSVMLANKKFYDEAREEFKSALFKHPDNLYLHESLSAMELYVGDPEAARQALEGFFNNSLTPNRVILELMLDCNRQRLDQEENPERKVQIRDELIATYQKLYKTDRQPGLLLEIANLTSLNEEEQAAKWNVKQAHSGQSPASSVARDVRDSLNSMTSNPSDED